MFKRLAVIISFTGALVFWPSMVGAQSPVNNNAGAGGLYSVNNSSYYQNPASNQQPSSSNGQVAGSASLLVQDSNAIVSVDSGSAPPFTKSSTKKSNSGYMFALYFGIFLFAAGVSTLVFGLIKKPGTPPNTNVVLEPVAETPTKSKNKTKRKNKKHHR